MKKLFSFLLLALFLSIGAQAEKFKEDYQGHIIAPDGTEYVLVGWEDELCVLGRPTFLDCIRGELTPGSKVNSLFPIGMYAVADDPEHSILMRHKSHSEWAGFYRRVSLPETPLTPDACIRLELLIGPPSFSDTSHLHCDGGLWEKEMIQTFLADLRNQPTAKEAGLYDLPQQSNGRAPNCHLYGTLYGFLYEDVNLALRFFVWSFDNQAFSISIEGQEYVLPTDWLSALQQGNHAQS